MARGRWTLSFESLALEAYVVLIEGKKPTKTFTKYKLQMLLILPPMRVEFLKLCFEYDDSDTLVSVRKGIFLIIRAYGPSDFCREVGINRNSLYRMLAEDGNPSLAYVMRLLKALKVRPWAVGEHFFKNRQAPVRPKDVPKGYFEGELQDMIKSLED